jgi:hypothetical protein
VTFNGAWIISTGQIVLHITNGESVSLPQTGLPGQVIYWNDTLHDGPVPRGLPLQELSRVRERFLAEFFGMPPAGVSFVRRDQAIANFRDHEEVVLWFEHDLYDQLQLIQILDWFSHQDLDRTRLSLISVDTYLGHMQPEQLRPLFETRHSVTAAELKTARAAWDAFCSSDPTGLAALVDSDTSALPFLRDALLRHLQQFPALHNGLSRAERQILQLTEAGLSEFRELFPAAQKLEEHIWMGDSTFHQYLGGLTGVRHPLLGSVNAGFETTAFGRQVYEGREDHIRANGINRWLGGVHLCEGAPVWRWDEAARIIRP